MQLAQTTTFTIIAVDLQKLVRDQLLNELHGDVLLIRTAHTTTICRRSASNMRQQALTWLMEAVTEKASYLAGKVSAKGGRFRVVSRTQAVELIATWIFKELHHGIKSKSD
jgi:hypothetical protein